VGQYLWVGTDVKRFRAENRGGSVAFSFVLTEESTLSFRVLDSAEREVARILPEARQAAGPQAGTWDGTNATGERVGAGRYLAEIRARATYASRSTYERRLVEPFTLGPDGGSP
jgi:flagellar hook assembly protein FlgD